MLLKYSLIGAVAAALFFPLPASAGSAITNPGGKYVPYGGGVGSFILTPVESTFIAVTEASSVLIPVGSMLIPVGALGDDFIS